MVVDGSDGQSARVSVTHCSHYLDALSIKRAKENNNERRDGQDYACKLPSDDAFYDNC